LHHVAVSCSVLQCVAVSRSEIGAQDSALGFSAVTCVCCSVLQQNCSVLQSNCIVLQCVAVRCSKIVPEILAHGLSVLACLCCSVLQCVAVCCSVLQCAAVKFVFKTFITGLSCSVLQCCSELQCGMSHMTMRHVTHDNMLSLMHMCHTATHLNTSTLTHLRDKHQPHTLQHTATHCNTLQHTVYGSTQQHTATQCRTPTTYM